MIHAPVSLKPFGWNDLKLSIDIGADSVECPVRGCQQVVPRQRKWFRCARVPVPRPPDFYFAIHV